MSSHSPGKARRISAMRIRMVSTRPSYLAPAGVPEPADFACLSGRGSSPQTGWSPRRSVPPSSELLCNSPRGELPQPMRVMTRSS